MPSTSGAEEVQRPSTSSNKPQKLQKKKEMTSYEEELLRLQRNKFRLIEEQLVKEHEAKMTAIVEECEHKRELFELQKKETELRIALLSAQIKTGGELDENGNS